MVAIVSIGLSLLLANVASVAGLAMVTATIRGGYLVGHLYIGEGLASPLRVALALIESLSLSFRAVSLSLRILCNSIAGHSLLLVLQSLVA